jgi:hypothetical protein
MLMGVPPFAELRAVSGGGQAGSFEHCGSEASYVRLSSKTNHAGRLATEGFEEGDASAPRLTRAGAEKLLLAPPNTLMGLRDRSPERPARARHV